MTRREAVEISNFIEATLGSVTDADLETVLDLLDVLNRNLCDAGSAYEFEYSNKTGEVTPLEDF